MKTIITSKSTKTRAKLLSSNNNDISNNISSNNISLNNISSNNISYNIDYDIQIQYLNKLYLDISFNEKLLVIKELRLKQRSYKTQDQEKKIYNEETFINIDDIIEKLVSCRLCCFYCREKMKVLYENVRDPLQWTLDRKNNNLDHSSENTIICCLQCNLQRRKKCVEAFRFTKQLKIVKK